ncbi:MAG: PTS sugar transporter subunit IIA [Desulfobacteraceae bacterium]|jgi:PTS system nitrogen regulatory IIA component|nr:PTS sugar transporter subunit IIA [Desulfobacteraceae bacterium]
MKQPLPEIACRMDLHVDTLERWIRQGRIPIRKSGGFGDYDESVLAQWARKHNLPLKTDADAPADACLAKEETLHQAMSRGGVLHGITGTDTESVLSQLVAAVPDLTSPQREELLQRLMEREALTSTGIGKGVAIPHPRSPISDSPPSPRIVTGFTVEPVHYRAIDDKPVFVLFLLLCPTTQIHLQLLSRLAFCLRDSAFLTFLQTQPARRELLDRIAGFDRQLEPA